MIKVDIISGFLGAGKTTLIKKFLDANKEEKIAIIENEFGEVSIDGDLLRKNNINIKEINSGCICCSIEGSFKEAIGEIINSYKPTKIIIEPSGVAKLSEVKISLLELSRKYKFNINYIFTVIDTKNYKMYMDNFSDFYKDQIVNAKTIVLTRIDTSKDRVCEDIINEIKKLNDKASIVIAPDKDLRGEALLDIAEIQLEKEKNKEIKKTTNNIVNRSIIKNKTYANNVFDSFGIETNSIVNIEKIKGIFEKLEKSYDYGFIIRGKGIVPVEKNKWIQFQYTPGNLEIKECEKNNIGKIIVIGEKINKRKLKELFS